MKRSWTLTIIVAILALPLIASAGVHHKLAAGKAAISEDNTVVVPLSVTNQDDLVGIDIALKYSPGVTIKEVRFENTRVDYFDLKATILDPDTRTIVIMMVPQISMDKKPALSAGEGSIAELVFEVTDPSTSYIELEPTQVDDPHHSCFFVYGTIKNGPYEQWREDPSFENGRVALSLGGGSVPTTYALAQNYPNPFNPSTEISFGLPQASAVELAIYNVLGQNVRTLVNGKMEAGSHTVTWDGRDGSGSQVSSGVYFYRITANNYSATKKMLLLK